LGSSEYFVVGDNVPVSLDSRDFGVIQERAVKGRVELIESH
jgi:type IV secretory pathway protease TraF